MPEGLFVALCLVGLILAAVELVQSHGRSLLAWGLAAVSTALVLQTLL